MKLDLIAFSSLAISALSPAFALSTAPHHDERWNPQHIEGLPAEVRSAVARVCGRARAEHQFASYFQNSHVIVLHFGHAHCGDRGALCTQSGCLHQMYLLKDGLYRLVRSYYGPEED
jgi:hypothetical protein